MNRLPRQSTHTILLAAAFLTAVAASTSARPALAAEFRWKFSDGDRFYVVESSQQKQSVTVERNPIQTEPDARPDSGADSATNRRTTTREQNHKLLYQFDVVRVLENGNVQLRMQLLGMRDEQQKPTELGRRLHRVQFTFHLTPAGAITNFEGYDEFVNQVSAGNLQYAQLIESVFSEDTLKKSVLEFLLVLPVGERNEDGSWAREMEYSLGPFGILQVARQFRPVANKPDDESQLLRFSIAGSATYQPPQPSTERLPFEIVDGQLKVQQLTGSGLYSSEKQRLVQLDMLLHVSGTLQIRVGDDQADITIDQTERSQTTFSESNPWES